MGGNVARDLWTASSPMRRRAMDRGKCCRHTPSAVSLRWRARSPACRRSSYWWSSALPHAVSLISTLAAGFGLALMFGFVAARLGLPALIGYLVAGIVIGPATPGFVADAEIAAQLAEIGVMLLMFGVGLHFSLDDLLAVRKIALPGAVVQMAVATALGAGVARCWGWTLGAALVFGLALSVASTVVLLKALEGRGELESGDGRIAVGWLIVEDLAMVLVLVVLPPLAGVARRQRRSGRGGGDGASLGLDPGEDARRGRGVRRADAGRRPARLSLGALAGGQDRLARAVHAGRDRRRGDDRLRLGAAVRRLVRARRLLRRHGAARIELQPSRRRGDPAAARRLRGAVLRLGGHAVRSGGAVRASRCACSRSWRSSSSASRSRRRRWCWPSATRCAPPSPSRPAWRRSASSRSSSAASACRSACCPAKRAA